MPTPTPEQESRVSREAVRLASRYRSIQDILTRGKPRLDASEEFQKSWGQTKAWLAQLNEDLHASPAEMSDPFADFVVRGANEITRSIESIQSRYTPELSIENATEYAAVVCCLLNAIYELAGKPSGVYNDLRALQESEFVIWTQALRQMLLVMKTLSSERSVEFSLEILSLDVSAQIKQGLDTAVLGPFIGVLMSFEWITSTLGFKVSQAVNRTKCLPIIELWGAILQWLYSERGGLIRRIRGFVSDILMHSFRNFRLGARAAGAELGDRLELSTRIDNNRIDLFIQILDAILDSTQLLRTCRLDPPDPDIIEDPDPTRDPSGEIQRPERDEEEQDLEDLEGEEDRRINNPRNPTGYIPPDIEDKDYVFLTPINTNLLLIDAFDLDQNVVRDITRTPCQELLAEDTRTALEQLGAL